MLCLDENAVPCHQSDYLPAIKVPDAIYISQLEKASSAVRTAFCLNSNRIT